MTTNMSSRQIEALRFYADPRTWAMDPCAAMRDGGRRAFEALKDIEAQQPFSPPQRHHFISHDGDSSPWCDGCGVFYRPERADEICPTPDHASSPKSMREINSREVPYGQ